MSSKYVKVKISENILSNEMFKIVFGRTEATAIINVGTVTSFFSWINLAHLVRLLCVTEMIAQGVGFQAKIFLQGFVPIMLDIVEMDSKNCHENEMKKQTKPPLIDGLTFK